jgi:hypothetical protein
MRRHVWIVLKSGEAGSGKGRTTCLSCRLIRWSVAAAEAIILTDLYGRDGIHWTAGPPGPCEPAR